MNDVDHYFFCNRNGGKLVGNILTTEKYSGKILSTNNNGTIKDKDDIEDTESVKSTVSMKP